MADERECSFYRRPGNSSMGFDRGYCEFDDTSIVCDGKIRACRKVDSLRQYLMGRAWMKVTIEERRTGDYAEEQWKPKEAERVR